uniref:Uncharacterized protein n=1 Tax=Roseihalotalea indica TaxID=2867963 RepID=A0AA49JK20_9BACT|nr:hypothetical protein K4G66_15470 [Tunicatimonas sp. TK19036]
MKTLKAVQYTKMQIIIWLVAFCFISGFPVAHLLGESWVKNPVMTYGVTLLPSWPDELAVGELGKVPYAGNPDGFSTQPLRGKRRMSRAKRK